MSLHPEPIGAIPAETARVARAAFPKGTLTRGCVTSSAPSMRMSTSASSTPPGANPA